MVKIIEDEQEAEKLKERLNEEIELAGDEDLKEYSSLKVNWIDNLKTWDEVKARMNGLMPHDRMFFLAHSRDRIKGKPQLVDTIKKRVILARKTMKVKGENAIIKNLFIDDKYDARYDGKEEMVCSLDFWVYRMVGEDNLDYFLFSDKKLSNEVCEINGMGINLSDLTEMTRTMKIKSLSRVFFVHDFEPLVKIVSKEELVEITKDVCEEDWIKYLAYHENNNFNRFPREVELLRSAFLLSGKEHGYPLHLAIMGPPGTRKTMGHIETLSYKFDETPKICEGAGSTLKGLGPSFKEKPANIGHLAKSNRVGWVDEIGKMVEKEVHKHQQQTGNYLGDLNFLLEHKSRLVGSGNDNECQIQATAKFMFVTNHVGHKHRLQNHVGLIDPSFMSRILWWVQDENETNFVIGEDGISPNTYTSIQEYDNDNENTREKLMGGLCVCEGELGDRSQFLTIFDTCYSFLCDIEDSDVHKLIKTTSNLAKEPMKTSVWRPRAFHHIKLLIDGLCKHRCLFIDHTMDFKANEQDISNAELILYRMVKSWDSSMQEISWQDNFN